MRLGLMVGTLQIARAPTDRDLSDQLLAAATAGLVVVTLRHRGRFQARLI